MAEQLPDVLMSEEKVQARVAELAGKVSQDYAEVDTLMLVGVLKGSFIFLADLARRLTVPRTIDFIAVSSYGESTVSSGAVRLILDIRKSIEGKHVLLVEDIVDTGHTLSYLTRTLRARRPASLKSCVLLSKPDRREVEAPMDYLGFEIPDVWVVGYGLDAAEKHRALPFIGVVHPDE